MNSQITLVLNIEPTLVSNTSHPVVVPPQILDTASNTNKSGVKFQIKNPFWLVQVIGLKPGTVYQLVSSQVDHFFRQKALSPAPPVAKS